MNFKKLSSSDYEHSTGLWNDTSSYVATIQQLTYYSSVKSEFYDNKEKSIATDIFGTEIAPTDTYYNLQRHLSNPGGYDLNVLPAWANFTGHGVKVGVLDQGIDGAHPDLAPNTDFFHAYDATNGLFGATYGRPVLSSDNHGTAVAGLIGAARNNVGVVGVAYDATLVPLYDPLSYGGIESRIPGAFLYAAANVDVLNNSWGFGNLLQYDRSAVFVDNFLSSTYAAAGQALKYLADEGRDGLGTAIVFAAGNGRYMGDNTNLHNFQNSRYAITVASADFLGQNSYFSTPGASILVSAFGQSGSIVTTDRTGILGYNTLTGSSAPSDGNYVFNFAGTSAAAPQVSGVIALILEANPNLGWRDIQEILAYTARNSARDNSDWQDNGARNFNGGGLHVSHDLGFGIVDAAAAIRLAQSWTQRNDSHNEITLNASVAPNALIPDAQTLGTTAIMPVAGDLIVEHIELRLKITHPNVGDLKVFLTSPSGTVATLIDRPGLGLSQKDDIDFTFSTPFFWSERATGVWFIQVIDEAASNVGRLESADLTIYGAPPTNDDMYIFTDEFGSIGGSNIFRQLLNDQNGGVDTINLAPLSHGVNLDLTSGGVIAGATILISSEALLENIIGSIGSDTLIGNRIANSILGGGGADTISGGNRPDTLMGEDGNDSLQGDYGDDVLVGGSGNDTINGGYGSDVIYGDDQDPHNAVGGGDLIRGADYNDTIYGGNGNDNIDGGTYHDYVHAGGGDDFISNLAGWMLGAGADTLIGGTGNDTIILRQLNWWQQVISFDDVIVDGKIMGTDLVNNFQSDWVDSSQYSQEFNGQVYQGPAYNPADILDVSGLLDDLGYARNLEIRQQAIAVEFSGAQLNGFNLFNLFVDTDHNGSAETLIAQIQNVTDFNPAVGTIDFNENFIWL